MTYYFCISEEMSKFAYLIFYWILFVLQGSRGEYSYSVEARKLMLGEKGRRFDYWEGKHWEGMNLKDELMVVETWPKMVI
jgi:hypothetical protein